MLALERKRAQVYAGYLYCHYYQVIKYVYACMMQRQIWRARDQSTKRATTKFEREVNFVSKTMKTNKKEMNKTSKKMKKREIRMVEATATEERGKDS